MTFKTKIHLFIVALFANAITAQSIIPVNPASAEVASFEKYIDQPVSLNSGMVDISVPIYSLREGELEVPVSLSYYPGGIKVEENASKVGLGWNLNAGGFISRSVKGLPDDSAAGYMYTTRTVTEFRVGMDDVQFSSDYNADPNSRDYEPDSFNFNFLNFSGRFYYDKSTSSFIQVPFTNNKLEPSFSADGAISSWVFTDEKGIKYYFGNTRDAENRTQVEKQFAVNSLNYGETGITGHYISSDKYISTWFLLKMESPKHDVIKLYYQESDLYDEVIQTEMNNFSKFCGNGNPSNYNYSSKNYIKRTIADTYLTRISSKTQDVIFENKTEERLDVPKTKALASISIKNGATLFKKYVLDYEYFISTDNNYRWAIGNSPSSRYRLKLKSVQEQTAAKTLPPYQFTYDVTNELPNKTSYAQDAWGYYNGATDNTTLLPKIYSPYVTDALIGSADRHIKLAFTTAGTLTKIKYPTGGSREFIYESNEVGLIVNLRDPNMFGEVTTKNDGLFPDDPGLNSPENNSGIRLQSTYSKQFTINNISGSVNINLDVEGSMGNMINTTDCHFTFKLSGITDPGYVLFFSQKTNAIKIPNGTYKIEANKQGDPLSMFGFAIGIAWDEMVLSANGAIKTGGLRIQKMITSDNNGNVLTKQFSYNKFDLNKSSGYCINYPVFLEQGYFGCIASYKFSSQSQMPQMNLGKSTIAYEYVTEYDLDGTNSTNGKTEYTYQTNYGVSSAPIITGNHRPMFDKTDKYIGWQVGYLLQADIYRAQGLGFTKIQSTVNTYERVGTYSIPDFGAISDARDGAVAYLIYPLTSDWFRQKSTTTTSYFDTGSPVTTSETYTYNTNPLLRFQTSKTNSLGDETITKTFYPDDIVSTTSIDPALTTAQLQVINLLKTNNLHQLSAPVQSEVFVKRNNVTSKTATARTTYKDWGNNVVFPENFQAAKGSDALEIKTRYDLIDNTTGNPLQYTTENGMSTAIIWGYNKTQPIAKVENATYAQVSTYVTNLQTLSDTGTEANLITALNALRTALPGTMLVSTYTYIPGIGISTITDAKEDKITYTYDTFGRLEFVKDKNGNILSENQYNYKP